MGSPSAIITLGLGSWGSTAEVITLGFGIGEAIVVTVPGLEYTAAGRLHWTVDTGLLHFTAAGRLHYTVPEEDA